jgi:hypothetical protein
MIVKVQCILLTGLLSCQGKKSVVNRLELDPAYKQIQKISATASCIGPKGRFSTTVEADTLGNIFFGQEYSFKDDPFYARVSMDKTGYVISPQGSILDTLPVEAMEIIRGHAFHLMQTRPDLCLTDIRFDQQTNDKLSLYSAKDGIGNPVSLHYDKQAKLITRIKTLNPADTSQPIDVNFTQWTDTEFGKMVRALKIIQGGRDTFNYQFNVININT